MVVVVVVVEVVVVAIGSDVVAAVDWIVVENDWVVAATVEIETPVAPVLLIGVLGSMVLPDPVLATVVATGTMAVAWVVLLFSASNRMPSPSIRPLSFISSDLSSS